ncbi:Hypothetical predicted protein [Pelobates cultripes]|uniref:Uncharacterized protein n=1 Tax=Pelobates cultripes TaxID=61616 RepID=A0AAD1SQY2_PELCU|nr:Hypothetical predicted protein [Pelobates cultripes]
MEKRFCGERISLYRRFIEEFRARLKEAAVSGAASIELRAGIGIYPQLLCLNSIKDSSVQPR